MGAKTFAAVLMATAVLPGAVPVHAGDVRVRVLQRELLGRYIEDVDYVPTGSGPFSGHLVILNGQEVHGFPATAGSNAAIRPLFGVRGLSMGNPTGIAYVASERLFAFVDSHQLTQLFLSDLEGRPLPPRTIRFPDGYMPEHIEGLAYVPPTSPRFPDHLLTYTWKFFSGFPFTAARLHVVRRDGQVVAEVPLPLDGLFFDFYGVAFKEPDQLLLDAGGGIFNIDFDGNLLNEVDGEAVAEGIIQLGDGRVVSASRSQLRFFDAALGRLPGDDRDASTSIGLILPSSVAWDPVRQSHLVLGTVEIPLEEPFTMVAAVPPSLGSKSPVVSLDDVFFRLPRVTYVPDEHVIVVALARLGGSQPRPPEIALYDGATGAHLETIDASATGGVGVAFKIAYASATGQFVVLERSQPSRLKVSARSGALLREIDLAPIGITNVSALAYFDPQHESGGRLLIFDVQGRAVITDFAGALLGAFDYQELGLASVTGAAAITSGPMAGAFTAVEPASSARLVVFRLE